MRFHSLLLTLAAGTICSGSKPCTQLPLFPIFEAYPKVPAAWQTPLGPNRNRVCTVYPDEHDAGPKILAAARKCNHGGTVYLPEGHYKISTSLDLTFLDHIDFAIYGTIAFDDNIGIWPDQTFHYPYQNAALFWRFGGTDVNIYGGGQGVIDGKGQTYWTAMTSNPNVERPTLFGTDGLHRSTITGLTMKNSPGWFNIITNSKNVLISELSLLVEVTNSSSPARNTDGWDTYRSTNIVIQNSVIKNTDDCVSFKPNSTAIIVQGLDCTGSHGISVGSLGQYSGEVDIVEDVYVYNTSMTNATDGARIKVWPGAIQGSGSLDGGGGTGRVRNITYELFRNSGNENAIALTQCYEAVNQTMCDTYPSEIIMDDVKWLSFSGTTNGKYDPRVGYITCSSPEICTNFVAHNISLSPASGREATYECVNLDATNMDINCVDPVATL